MTSEEQPKEFRRRNQVTMQMQLTPQQHAAIASWSAMVPTIHFLDINVVNATKNPDVEPDQNPRKAKLVADLKGLDKPQNAFSYLLALIEKVSDLRGTMSDTDLQAHILDDLRALRAFFKNASVVESDEYAIEYLQELRGVAHEVDRPSHLVFLETINNRFNLRDPVAPALRFRTAKEVVSEADALSISRQHPVVLLTLACLYGNRSAKHLLKLKANPGKFDPQNALADIMAISRLAVLKLQIEQEGGWPWKRAKFITDDDGLGGVLDCFEPVSVKITENADGADTEFTFEVNLVRLLTELQTHERSDQQETLRGLLTPSSAGQ